MNKIDPEICYHLLVGNVCMVTWRECNPDHPDCEYDDERKLGIPEELKPFNENS